MNVEVEFLSILISSYCIKDINETVSISHALSYTTDIIGWGRVRKCTKIATGSNASAISCSAVLQCGGCIVESNEKSTKEYLWVPA